MDITTQTAFSGRRRAVRIVDDDLTRSFIADPGKGLPLVVESARPDQALLPWTVANRDRLHADLLRHGAILFRNFAIATIADFRSLAATLSGALLDYSYASTPRTLVSEGIYTSTDYPADQSIPLHNEMSYASDWPGHIFFFCMTASETGGETPVADSRTILKRIDPEIRDRFARTGVRYVRNYGHGLDLPWQEVFKTIVPAEVETICRDKGIHCEWTSGSTLRTWQTCQAVTRHPTTGDDVWFNQAHLFHVSSLPSDAQTSLQSIFAPEDLPRNAFYGDGAPIELDALAHIRAAYAAEQHAVPWRQGDVLMLDNVLAAHGRNPFTGARRIVVAMTRS